MACDPNALTTSAKCFQCLSHEQQLMVQAYLLALIAGASTDPKVLVVAAAPFQSLSEKELLMVQAYLLCKISGG
jgi:hypothetical protein